MPSRERELAASPCHSSREGFREEVWVALLREMWGAGERERHGAGAALETLPGISSAGAEGLEKEETGELKSETIMGVTGEMECRDKETGFYTFNNGKPLKVFTIGGGTGDRGAEADLKIILEAKWGLLPRTERQGACALLSPSQLPFSWCCWLSQASSPWSEDLEFVGLRGPQCGDSRTLGPHLAKGFCPQ